MEINIKLNSYTYKKLQKGWNENKEDNFEIKTVERFSYEKGEGVEER